LRVQPKAGGILHLRLNKSGRPIANKYRKGKMQRTLKREFKELEVVEREAIVGTTRKKDRGENVPGLDRRAACKRDCWALLQKTTRERVASGETENKRESTTAVRAAHPPHGGRLQCAVSTQLSSLAWAPRFIVSVRGQSRRLGPPGKAGKTDTPSGLLTSVSRVSEHQRGTRERRGVLARRATSAAGNGFEAWSLNTFCDGWAD